MRAAIAIARIPAVAGSGVPSKARLTGTARATEKTVEGAVTMDAARPAMCPTGSRAIAFRLPIPNPAIKNTEIIHVKKVAKDRVPVRGATVSVNRKQTDKAICVKSAPMSTVRIPRRMTIAAFKRLAVDEMAALIPNQIGKDAPRSNVMSNIC